MKDMHVSLVCWLVIVHHGFAVPEGIPPDVFKAQRGGYLYAEYPRNVESIFRKGTLFHAPPRRDRLRMWVHPLPSGSVNTVP